MEENEIDFNEDEMLRQIDETLQRITMKDGFSAGRLFALAKEWRETAEDLHSGISSFYDPRYAMAEIYEKCAQSLERALKEEDDE